MNTFLELNKHKLSSTFIRLSLVLLGLVGIVLAIAWVTGNLPDIRLLISIVLGAGVGLPVFIMFVGYVSWIVNHNAREKAFSMAPFDQVEKIGFQRSYARANSKWAFTDLVKSGQLNGFTWTMNRSEEKHNTIEFETAVEWRKLKSAEYRRLSDQFKQYNIELRMGTFVKFYNLQQGLPGTTDELKQDLESFATLFVKEGFTPKAYSTLENINLNN